MYEVPHVPVTSVPWYHGATAREFARYRLLRVPFVDVPRAVIRDRHAGRREARAVPAQGPMQADFFRHQADIWQAVAG